MNTQQITFTKNFIAESESTVKKLETEMKNPRSRPGKNEIRRKAIADLNDVIAHALKSLFDAGVIAI